MVAQRATDAFIESSPKIRGGRPRIAGTGITVHRIVRWYKMGESPEDIAGEIYEHLNLAQVYAAMAYYFANQAEIDAEIEAEIAEEERIEREWYQSQGKGLPPELRQKEKGTTYS